MVLDSLCERTCLFFLVKLGCGELARSTARVLKWMSSTSSCQEAYMLYTLHEVTRPQGIRFRWCFRFRWAPLDRGYRARLSGELPPWMGGSRIDAD